MQHTLHSYPLPSCTPPLHLPANPAPGVQQLDLLRRPAAPGVHVADPRAALLGAWAGSQAQGPQRPPEAQEGLSDGVVGGAFYLEADTSIRRGRRMGTPDPSATTPTHIRSPSVMLVAIPSNRVGTISPLLPPSRQHIPSLPPCEPTRPNPVPLQRSQGHTTKPPRKGGHLEPRLPHL